MADVTWEGILEAFSKIRHAQDPQLQFLEDREAASKDDVVQGRGHLVLNPELDLSALDDPDVHGRIIEKDGIEYRVIVDERIRGMVDLETGKMRQGWWLPPINLKISHYLTPTPQRVSIDTVVSVDENGHKKDK